MSRRTIGVAVAVPEPYGSELQGWRERFGDPAALKIPTHVTLLPPTAVEDAQLPEVEKHLLDVARDRTPFVLHLRGTASFRPISPVVFVAVVGGISDCELLATAVRSGPLSRDLPFPYHPHVTVAHDLPSDVLDHAFDALAHFEARVTITAFSLYEHGADGVWRPQRDFTLGGPLPCPEEH